MYKYSFSKKCYYNHDCYGDKHIYGDKLTCFPNSSSPEYAKWRILFSIKYDIILTKDQRICVYLSYARIGCLRSIMDESYACSIR